jgi:hypothetical protein
VDYGVPPHAIVGMGSLMLATTPRKREFYENQLCLPRGIGSMGRIFYIDALPLSINQERSVISYRGEKRNSYVVFE